MSKKAWVWLLVVVVIIVAIVLIKKPTTTVEGDTIKIGFVGALSGDAAAYGESAKQGVELAVSQINANGGVKGKQVEVIYEDAKCTGKDAVSAAQKLVNVDKVKFIIGGSCSGETIAMAPIVEAAKVLTLSPISSNPTISTMGDYIFRNHPSDNQAGSAISNLIMSNTKSAAVIAEQTDYSQGLRKVFVDSYTAAGGTLAFDESFAVGTTDFRSLVSKIKATGVTAVFVDAQTEASFIQIATQMKDLGVKAQIYTAYITGDNIIKKADLLNGMIAVDLPSLGTMSKASEFTASFNTMFAKNPNYPYFAAAAYDATYLLTDGILKHGYDSTKVKDFLYGIKEYTGAAGTYHFDENGDVVGVSLTNKKLENGAFVEVK